MHFPTAVCNLFARVNKYAGLSIYGKRNRDNEIVDEHSESNGICLRPQIKRRKMDTSLIVNSKYESQIMDWLGNDEITSIGISGMGGIGKTKIAKQVESRLLSCDILSYDIHDIAWVSVGMDCSVYQLQQKIAAAFRIDLDGDVDEIRRSAMIHAFLSRWNKCVLFLDDLWEDFRLEDVGIPKQCKRILISRSLDVCRILRCQKVVRIEPLSEEEGWELFRRNIEFGNSDCKILSSVRKFVYDWCAGLPLAITVLAKSMGGKVDSSTWTEILTSKNPFSTELSPEFQDVICQLKFSYDRLNNTKLQQCFLSVVLYPGGRTISKEELIELWITKRLIDQVESSQVQYDMGYCIVNKLINTCLLEPCQDEKMVKVHDLVWSMAASLAAEKCMMKAGSCSNMKCLENLHVYVLKQQPSSSLIPSYFSFKITNLSNMGSQGNILVEIPNQKIRFRVLVHVIVALLNFPYDREKEAVSDRY
ncbi:unnamed protein product [Amaranthus hypochondriacus]